MAPANPPSVSPPTDLKRPRQVVRFGGFEFDPASGELRRGGDTTRLEPQPARVLAMLVERPGALVTRAELKDRIWSGDTFVDFDRGLNYCISQIRTALGDAAAEPTFVETLPRRGYRFVAAIDAPASAPRPRTSPQTRRAIFAVLAVASAVEIVVMGTVAWRSFARRSQTSSATAVRIAVVPFDNETGMASYDQLAQTLTDAVVARLAANPMRVAVIGNAAILRTPRASRDLKSIGAALGVGDVVMGQVQLIDGQLRVTTHLIRVDDQTHLWAHRFEPSGAETSTLDRAVPDAVASAVSRKLLGG